MRQRDIFRVAAAALVADDPHRFEHDLLADGRIFQALQHLLVSAFLRPLRDERGFDPIARCGVRILIEGGVHAAAPRLVDQFQRVHAPAEIPRADHFVMRDLCGKAAFLADANRFLHAVDHAERLVAHVRDVDAAEAARDFSQLDDFVGG